jgi:hypothetical protein
LKSLSIGNAAAYVIANWDRLERFVKDARIPLDNNATERVGARLETREFGPEAGYADHRFFGLAGGALARSSA